MTRQLITGLIVAAAAAGIVACSTAPPAAPTSASTSTTSTTVDATVDGFVGAWTPDPADGGPTELGGPENTAESIVPDGACRFVEFKVDRDADSTSAKVAFAAKCANARLRGFGAGVLSNGVLHWRAQGELALASGNTCQFKFVEGNMAVRVPEGLKVHYNGTVCDVSVSGTQIVKKKP